jgi:hypothetical protein
MSAVTMIRTVVEYHVARIRLAWDAVDHAAEKHFPADDPSSQSCIPAGGFIPSLWGMLRSRVLEA